MSNNTYNAGSDQAVKKAKKKWQLRQEQNAAELEQLVNTPGGAYFLWRVLSECGLYNSAPSDDPAYLAVHEGKRRVGLWLLGELTAINEELYTKVRRIGAERDKGE